MEETIHINIGGYPTKEGFVSIYVLRLWPSMLASLRWITKNSVPGHNLIQGGIGLCIINNLAISIEGFISDMVVQKLDTNDGNKAEDILSVEKGGWKIKSKLYNKHFPKDLNSYHEFEAIKNLFLLRNNISHGLSHSEMTQSESASGNRSNVQSMNKDYQTVRTFLTKKGFLRETDTPSTIEVLWRIDIALFFLSIGLEFLSSIMRDNNYPEFQGISMELNNVFAF